MKKLKTFSALTATAILCLGFVSCSDKEPQKEDTSIDFTHNTVYTENTVTRGPGATSSAPITKADESAATTAATKPSSTASTTVKETSTTAQTTSAPTTVLTPVTTAATTAQTTTAPTTTQAAETTAQATEAPTTAALTDGEDKGFEQDALKLINEERKKQGLDTLALSSELAAAADIRAKEQSEAGIMSHTRPDGSDWDTVSPLAMAENLAMGQSTAASVVSAWLNSEGHRKNMLNSDYKTAGIACCYNSSTGVYYWVLLLGY